MYITGITNDGVNHLHEMEATGRVTEDALKEVATAKSENINKGQTTDLQGLLAALSKIPCQCPKHKEYHSRKRMVGSSL